MCGLGWRQQQEAGHRAVGRALEGGPTRLGLLSASESHFSLRHWFLSRPSDHTPASGAEQTSSDVCKLQKSFHRETVIKQVLTGLCVCIKMMQSNDNNLLLLRLNSKFNLSLRNAAQFNRITIAACALLTFALKRGF